MLLIISPRVAPIRKIMQFNNKCLQWRISMNLNNHIKTLKNSPLFRDFDADYLNDFLSKSEYVIKAYGKEDMIFIEDEVCTTLSIVLEGSVEIQKIESSGKILTVAQFTEGDTFGENLIFSD